MDETCTCGDHYDEHEDGARCLICPCVHFEADDADPEPFEGPF